MNINTVLKFVLLFSVICIAGYVNYFIYYNQTLEKLFYSMIIIFIALVANDALITIIRNKIHDIKERYSMRKALSAVLTLLVFAVILGVWFTETTSLIVAYGIISAGIAIALQDVLKNAAGGFIIFFSTPFRAGDRIQVDNNLGDVIDINIFSTSIMETREWVDGDQFSGRILQVPNGFVLNTTIKNYTKDFSFIWDEIFIMLTYDSNWKKAQGIILNIAHEVTSSFEDAALKELTTMGEKYLISQNEVSEKIYTKLTDNWIDLRLRYVVDPRQRRPIKTLLFERILEGFAQEKDIHLASETLEISGFPKIKIDKADGISENW
jgi:small-conductance mechanosensitive channel